MSIIIYAFLIKQLQLILLCVRLKYILHSYNLIIPFKNIYILNSLGGILSQTPLSFVGGDALRIVMLEKEIENYKYSVSSVVVDRFIGFLGMMICVIVSIPFLILENKYFIDLIYIFFILVISIIFLEIILININVISYKFPFSEKIYFFLNQIVAIRNKKNYLKCLLLSMSTYLITSICMIQVSENLNSKIPYYFYFISVPIVSLFSAMPMSFGGWGVREFGYLFLMNKLNVTSEFIIIVSIIYGLVSILSYLPGVIAYYVFKKYK